MKRSAKPWAPTRDQREALESLNKSALWEFMSLWWEDDTKDPGRRPGLGTLDSLVKRGLATRTYGISPDTCRMAGYRGGRIAISENGRRLLFPAH